MKSFIAVLMVASSFCIISPAASQNQSEAEAQYKLASKFLYKYDRKSQDSARYYLSKSIAADSKYALAYYSRSKTWDYQKEKDKKISDLNLAIKYGEKKVYLEERANLLIGINEYDLAKADLMKLQKIDPKNYDYPTKLGEMFLLQEDYKNALQSFKIAFSQKQIYLTHYNLAQAYYGLKDFKAAKNYADSAVVKWPSGRSMFSPANKETPYMLRGQIQLGLGKFAEAIEDLTTYLKSGMSYIDKDALYYRAQAYCKLGKKKEADEDMKQYLPLKGSRFLPLKGSRSFECN